MKNKGDKKLIKEAKDYFLAFVKDDYTQLGFLTDYISDENPDLNSDSVANMTKIAIKELMEENQLSR